MTRAKWIVLIVCALAASGAFLVTALAQPGAQKPTATAPPRSPAMTRWLRLSASQAARIVAEDPSFEVDAAAMQQHVRSERAALAALLEAPEASDERILAQIDRVNEAEHALERRVVEYLLKVREHLTADQQLKLMGLAAECVRGRGHGGQGRGLGPGYGPGPGPGGAGRGQGGEGRGLGPPSDRGPGSGGGW